MTPVQECCVCYSTVVDIEPELKNSFIIIPCGGHHVVCFSCFMRNDSAKCPMCRFNYKTMKRDEVEAAPRVLIDQDIDYPSEPNQDLDIIDHWWGTLKNRIPEMLPIIDREVFQKGVNLRCYDGSVGYGWVCDSIEVNSSKQNHIIDLETDYEMCCRMHLTKILVAYNEIDGDDYTDFVAAVNDFIQHEYDTWWC